MRIEWPTLGLLALVYGAWLVLTWHHTALPWWVWIAAGGWTLAWHNSLQHEAIHGHPTGSAWVNAVLAGVPLSLWLPWTVYRHCHQAHHRTRALTVPGADPESFYLRPSEHADLGSVRRALHRANQTLVGRLVVGPWLVVASTVRAEGRRVRVWALHGLAVLPVIGWLAFVGMPAWIYVGAVWLGLSLTLLRSYVEHWPTPEDEGRTAVVEGSPLLGLLFLFNNLHVVHHRRPQLPWYAIPAAWREIRDQVIREGEVRVFSGYGEVLRRYALWPKDDVVHPGLDR